ADAACAHRIPLDLAKQIVEAFSNPGDLVYVPEAGNASCLIAPVQSRRKVLAFAASNAGSALAYDTLQAHAIELASLAILRPASPGTSRPAWTAPPDTRSSPSPPLTTPPPQPESPP